MPNNKSFSLKDDPDLLKVMTEDANNAPPLYLPGPYWMRQSKSTLKDIYKYGINDFRGLKNSIGTYFADSSYVDVRINHNLGAKSLTDVTKYLISRICKEVYPINHLFDAQVKLTHSYFVQLVREKNDKFFHSARFNQLLEKYQFPVDNIRGGCLSFGKFDDKVISHRYAQMVDTLDRISEKIELSKVSSYFEIGGGFGTFLHCILENYPNIRKVIYLDIAPNLYVGTQYLKSFFGDCVKTYSQTRSEERIVFECNDELEIFCIAPWQIEKLDVNIDFFHNAHSFVEMPKSIVSNYAKHVRRVMSEKGGYISLVSYDSIDLKRTFDPSDLSNIFSLSFEAESHSKLSAARQDYHFFAKI